MKKIKNVTIRGQPWDVRWLARVGPKGNQVGLCWFEDHVIEIYDDQSEIDKAETLVHEMLHAEFPEMPEDDVEEAAGDIVAALKALGVLKRKKKTKPR